MITGKMYDSLKFLALVALPAAGSLYFALAAIWGLPAAQQVVGTITVIDTFLGTLLQLSSNSFNKNSLNDAGTINVQESPEKTLFSLDLNHPPEKLKDVQSVTFKVRPKEVPPPPIGPTPQR